MINGYTVDHGWKVIDDDEWWWFGYDLFLQFCVAFGEVLAAPISTGNSHHVGLVFIAMVCRESPHFQTHGSFSVFRMILRWPEMFEAFKSLETGQDSQGECLLLGILNDWPCTHKGCWGTEFWSRPWQQDKTGFTGSRISGRKVTGVGKCPFLGILNITFKYLLEIISPMVGWCSIGTFTNPWSGLSHVPPRNLEHKNSHGFPSILSADPAEVGSSSVSTLMWRATGAMPWPKRHAVFQ